MYCKKCGKAIPDDSKYCPFCGEDLFDIPPIHPMEFNETKNHIDSHRYGSPICELKIINKAQETKKVEKQGSKLVLTFVKVAFACVIVACFLSIPMIFVANMILHDSKAFSFKIAYFIIVGINYLMAAGVNFTILFLKHKDNKPVMNTITKSNAIFRIIYFLIGLAAAIILFICANAFIHNPAATDEGFYTTAPMVLSLTELMLSGAMIGMNSTLLAYLKKN